MFATKSIMASPPLALLLAFMVLSLTSHAEPRPAAIQSVKTKRVIGPTALVQETESDFSFPARVDTGATTSSLHVEEWQIEAATDVMAGNVGKMIRFRIKNHNGESEWLKRKIVELSLIQTSEQAEHRYKVKMTLTCLNVKKCVLVSLNDRSHMTYPVLLGRNFLQGDFVVDVDLVVGSHLVRKPDLSGNGQIARAPVRQLAVQKKWPTSRQASVFSPSDRKRPIARRAGLLPKVTE